jgi:hypothetical protein
MRDRSGYEIPQRARRRMFGWWRNAVRWVITFVCVAVCYAIARLLWMLAGG